MARKDATQLTDPQRAFCDAYLGDPTRHATRAYQVAYPKIKREGAARTNASRLLTNPKVNAYLQARLDKLHAKAAVTQQRIIDELACVAFFDSRALFDEFGEKRLIQDMDESTARGMGSMSDKLRALELLGKNLKMWTEKVEHSGTITTKADWVKELLAAVKPTVGPPGQRDG